MQLSISVLTLIIIAQFTCVNIPQMKNLYLKCSYSLLM